jgi:hypothetical protein
MKIICTIFVINNYKSAECHKGKARSAVSGEYDLVWVGVAKELLDKASNSV